MYLDFNGELMYIEDKYVSNSPYLETLFTSMNNVDTYLYEINGKKEVVYPLDRLSIKNDDFYQYLRLMSGYSTIVTNRLLDYMGHNNYLKYPNDVWNAKIHDNWIRNNFYRYPEILQDPYYDLEEVSIIEDRLTLVEEALNSSGFLRDKTLFLAGGGAMFVGGIIDDIRDLDIFTTDMTSLSRLNLRNPYVLGHVIMADITIEFNLEFQELRIPTDQYYYNGKVPSIQYILRQYNTPSEIVHGFDLDCCGYILDLYNRRLYRTKRAALSTKKRMNYFDPERSSPSYAHRLGKYKLRMFDIWLPYHKSLEFNEDKYEEISKNVLRDIIAECIYDDDISLVKELPNLNNVTMEYLEEYTKDATTTTNIYGVEILCNLLFNYSHSGYTDFVRYVKARGSLNPNVFYNNIPRDPASIIALVKYKNVLAVREDPDADYEIYGGDIIDYVKGMKLDWKINNPMEQDQSLTGTFYPEPITIDVFEWYAKSPLLIIKDE